MEKIVSLTISHLAGQGDGVAQYEGRSVFVPYVCTGEQVDVVLPEPLPNLPNHHARLIRVVQASADRTSPPCEYFGRCGGCKLQHLSLRAYTHFKEAQLRQLLMPLGENLPMEPMWSAGAQSRRRAQLSVQMHKGKLQLGFHQLRSHQLVDIAHCVVLNAPLNHALQALRDFLPTLKKPHAITAIHLSEVEQGVDMRWVLQSPLPAAEKTMIQAWAAEQNIPRLVLQMPDGTQEKWVNHPVTVQMANIAVELPVGAFLQASHSAQMHMIEIMKKAVAQSKNVMDIYCGIGTFTLPLLKQHIRVQAYEGESDMVAALYNAAHAYGLSTTLHAETRDLYRTPIPAEHISGSDAVIINPPRNGAEPQIKQIAKSNVQTVVMVSCYPTTFVRDAKWLLKAGYRIEAIYPVDQFMWSDHLEIIAIFHRN